MSINKKQYDKKLITVRLLLYILKLILSVSAEEVMIKIMVKYVVIVNYSIEVKVHFLWYQVSKMIK